MRHLEIFKNYWFLFREGFKDFFTTPWPSFASTRDPGRFHRQLQERCRNEPNALIFIETLWELGIVGRIGMLAQRKVIRGETLRDEVREIFPGIENLGGWAISGIPLRHDIADTARYFCCLCSATMRRIPAEGGFEQSSIQATQQSLGRVFDGLGFGIYGILQDTILTVDNLGKI